MNHGWQSESTDGPKGGWSCVFSSGCSGHLSTSAGCSVVSCSCSCSIMELSCNVICVVQV